MKPKTIPKNCVTDDCKNNFSIFIFSQLALNYERDCFCSGLLYIRELIERGKERVSGALWWSQYLWLGACWGNKSFVTYTRCLITSDNLFKSLKPQFITTARSLSICLFIHPIILYFIAIVLFCEYDFFADMKFLESKDSLLPYMNSMYIHTLLLQL